MTALRSHDFPSLQPQSPGDEDYASILQATLALAQLFTNVHEVLYSGMGSSMKMMLVGNYVKYVDDFRMAISSWKSVWGTLTCKFRFESIQRRKSLRNPSGLRFPQHKSHAPDVL
jgi:hypothetical protein